MIQGTIEDFNERKKEIAFMFKKTAINNKFRQFPKRQVNPVPISSDDSALEDVMENHHCSLVIKIQIGTSNVRKVLINGGSSVITIMTDTLKKMGMKDD